MPSIRIGLSTDFNLVGEQVGIGTTNPTARVDVAGQILADNTAGSGGVSTFREYQGFHQTQSNIANNVLIDNGSSGPFSSLSGEIRITGETTVSSGSTVEVGKTKTLTVTNKFAVPLGDTNSRDNTPEAGTTRFNQDFGTLEFFDGNNWKTVNSYARYHGGAAGRMVLGSGVTPGYTNVIQYFNINTFGNSEYFGDLTLAKGNISSCSSAIRGIWAGGAAGSYSDIIEYVTIASAGNSIDFGQLSTANRAYMGATSSSTRGIFGGGYTTSPSPATVDIIDYIEMSTKGNALDFGNLFVGRYSAGAVSNGVRAVWGGGNTPNRSVIDFVNIAAKGNAVFFGDLTTARRNCAGGSFSNNVRGCFSGGQTPALLNVIDYITIASEGNAVDFGSLSTIRARPASSSTNTRGVMAGGLNPSVLNSIEYVNITSTGDAQDFGDLYLATGTPGGCSDSHGGLGGF
jgi:hypothetical protein